MRNFRTYVVFLIVFICVLISVSISAQTPLSPGRGAPPAGTATTDAQCWATATLLGICTDPIFSGTVTSARYLPATDCADSAGAAACGSAAAGSFVIDASSTATVVSTTAVKANSQVILQNDSSLGTRLGVTCNTQSSLTLGAPRVTARTANTSFTATIEVGPTTNPMCVSYWIVN